MRERAGYDARVTDPQVLIDPRGATEQELRTSVATLLDQVPGVELVDPTPTQLADLTDRFGARVRPADAVRSDVPVLVGSGRVCWAAGAVRRILADLATPGRSLTRVVVHGLPVSEGQVACWAPRWVAGFTGTAADLARVDLGFDRDHLPRTSPVVRSWLRADAVGVTLVSDVGEDARRWSRRTGLLLTGQRLAASVRAPLGALRRRVRRRSQRRRHEAGTHLAA